MKFGKFDVDDGLKFKFRKDKLTLEKAEGDSYLYERVHEGESVAKTLFSSGGGKVQLAVYPVRPIQVPKQLSHNIMVKPEPTISIPPGSHVIHHLTMPIEIGVFVANDKDHNYMIDAFSLSFPKYLLYGTPDSGYICRLHKSGIFSKPTAKPYEEAVIIMRFENKTTQWVTISKVVMDAYLVDLYLKGDTVYLEQSGMVIEAGNVASVFLKNKPPLSGLYEVPMVAEMVRKFRLNILARTGFGVAGKFIMEHGY